jgi:thymidine kinase
VGIDEAQFFDESVVEVANQLANSGTRVVIAGLDMDFMGRPFGPMPNLMATAEYVTKVHAICKRTGNLANYSLRTSASKDLAQLEKPTAMKLLAAVSFGKRCKSKRKINDILHRS